MSSNPNNGGFFEWVVGLLKKPKPVVIEPTAEQIAADANWILIKSKYSLEYLPLQGAHFVRYRFKDQWWYLRRWDDDYTLERVRGNAIRIPDTSTNIDQDFDFIIRLHQEWINEGHIFLNYE